MIDRWTQGYKSLHRRESVEIQWDGFRSWPSIRSPTFKSSVLRVGGYVVLNRRTVQK